MFGGLLACVFCVLIRFAGVCDCAFVCFFVSLCVRVWLRFRVFFCVFACVFL